MKTCLILEDSELIREIASRILKELSVTPAEAESAAKGLDQCRASKIDAVMLDWDLPAMGALDFLRGAAELLPEQKPVIILCATENDPQQFTLAKAAGAAHYLLKPFDKGTVGAKLAEIGLIDGAKITPASPPAAAAAG
jgi:two-component system chemotaxis response regulator CheY